MLRILELLLKKRADTEAKAKHGFTPLLLAVTDNNVPAVKLLLEYAADVEVCDFVLQTVCHLISTINCFQATTEDTKLKPIHLAVQNDNKEIVKVNSRILACRFCLYN